MRKQSFLDGIYIALGCTLMAFALVVFTIPNNIAPGGLSGLATAVAYLSGLPVGVLTLALNAPLLLFAWRVMGLKPLIKTIIATVLFSALIDVFSFLPEYTGNSLLAALAGGVVMGAGMGLLLARSISTGGTDLLSMILGRRGSSLSIGRMLMLIDTAVVIIAYLAFRDVDAALYSVFTIAVCSKTIDAIQQGIDHAKVVYIITNKQDALIEFLTSKMDRGVTILPARGGFSGADKAMLMVVERRNEVFATLRAIKDIDPDAFTIISDATSVYGEGFKV